MDKYYSELIIYSLSNTLGVDTLSIRIFIGWQDLQLGPYFAKWQPAIDQGLLRFSINYFRK